MQVYRDLAMRKSRRLPPEEKEASKERAKRKRRLRRLWAGELTIPEISDEMEMPVESLLAFAKSLGLGDRTNCEMYLPTAEQIRVESAAIRANWTQVERESRRAEAWSVRIKNTTDRDINAGRGATRRDPQGSEADPREG